MLLLAITPFVAGVDFLMGENTAAMSIVERSMPPAAWAGLLMLASIMAVGGYITRRPRLCIAGLHLTGVVFFALAVGVGWASVDLQGGFRGPWLYLVVSATSWLAALGYAEQIRGGRG